MKLGTWVHTQRIQYRKPMNGAKRDTNTGSDGDPISDDNIPKGEEMTFRLTEERRIRLEEAGFVWSARKSDAKAEQNRITRNTYDVLWEMPCLNDWWPSKRSMGYVL